MIGKLEELTLLAAIRAGDLALANDVVRNVNTVQKVSFGAIYTTLTRLSHKGFLNESEVIDDQGRTRRGFSITGNGRSALNEALNASAGLGAWAVGGVHAYP